MFAFYNPHTGSIFSLTPFPANRPFSYLYAVPPFSGFRFAFGWNTLAPFFAGCLAAAGLDGLRRAAPPLRAWVGPAVGLGLAALALGYGHRVAAAVGLVCAASALPPLRARGASILRSAAKSRQNRFCV